MDMKCLHFTRMATLATATRVSTTRFLFYRCFSTEVPEAVSKAIATTDVYGPPDPKSSLRLITFYIAPDETEAEKEYRLRRAQVQEWNHLFWTIHNVQFTQAKEEFVTSVLERRGKDATTTGQPLTADDLSEFYRAFLDQNREKHLKYNVEWHMKNMGLLWPGIKANLSRFKKGFSTM
ncbi:COA8 family protein Y39B6A.34, mitochondrial-like [Daphnia pulex]|uniref:COA8 family protein Y39B6A.34, mitochondrial-like n=1 Tax=Daphnia pulex TaxID=6669 RepID=UPI001EDCC6B7|nr:COA8 family protein Y39B6A.34, mitochondrial-like [Daphnia pulex]